MSNKISKKQEEILDFLKAEVAKRGYPPSVREICQAVDLKSTSTVHAHLTKLEKIGCIKRDPTKPRAIEICCDDSSHEVSSLPLHQFAENTHFVPIIGEITAGAPILAFEQYDEQFPLPKSYTDDGEYYMLKVKGDSMINAGIFDRDLVLVRKQNHANSGDIVVALIDETATVKTFYKEANQFRLQPENDTLSPIYLNHVDILGLVKGVFRKF